MTSYFLEYNDYMLALEKNKEIFNNYKDYEEIYIDLDEDGVYSLVDELTTVSLFGSLKYVIVKNANMMIFCESQDAKNSLLKAISDPDNLNVVIFLIKSNSDDNTQKDDEQNNTVSIDVNDKERKKKDRKFISSIKKISTVESAKLGEKNSNVSLEQYAINFLQKDGFNIDKVALSMLINNSINLEFLHTNIEKLKCYKWDEKYINSNDVELLVNKSTDSKIYELTTAIIKHDKKLVFEIYEDLKEQTIDAVVILSSLINFFQMLYDILVLYKAKISKDEIASLLGISSGRVYYLNIDATSFGVNEILKHLDLLNDLDFNIKQGLIDKNVGLEIYLLR